MKRLILLFVFAVFTIMAASCVGGTSVPPAAQDSANIPPQYHRVFIITADITDGNKPEVDPLYVELRYDKAKHNNQVKWIITSNVVFTITFDGKEGSPFDKMILTNKDTKSQHVVSGRIRDGALPEDATEKVYKYTLEVGDQKIDPGVIVFR